MEVQKTVEKLVTITQEYVCNRCGETCTKGSAACPTHEYLTMYFNAGYNAEIFNDGDYLVAHMCESCTKWLFDQFKIPASNER